MYLDLSRFELRGATAPLPIFDRCFQSGYLFIYEFTYKKFQTLLAMALIYTFNFQQYFLRCYSSSLNMYRVLKFYLLLIYNIYPRGLLKNALEKCIGSKNIINFCCHFLGRNELLPIEDLLPPSRKNPH